MSATPFEARVQAIDGFAAFKISKQNNVLIFLLIEGGAQSVTVARLDALRAELHLARGATAVDLSRRSKGKNRELIKCERGYALERKTRDALQKEIGSRPTALVVSVDLRTLIVSVLNVSVKDYLTEALGCFEAKYFRASVVFSWCAAFDHLREWLFSNHLAAINSVMASWRAPKSISKIEDFDEHAERTILDTAKTAGALNKGEHKSLVALLDTRNTYAHPSGKGMSSPVAEAFITQCITDVLKHFQ